MLSAETCRLVPTRFEVEQWLEQYGIKHHYRQSLALAPAGLLGRAVSGNRQKPESVGLDPHRLGGMVEATIRHANVDIFWDGDIKIHFLSSMRTQGLVGHTMHAWIDAL